MTNSQGLEASPALQNSGTDIGYDNPTNQIKNPASPWTALEEPVKDPTKMRFFGFRFMSIWVLPMAVTGIIMEFLFVSPLRSINPFN